MKYPILIYETEAEFGARTDESRMSRSGRGR